MLALLSATLGAAGCGDNARVTTDAHDASDATPPAGTRTDALIDDGWLFLRADAAGAEAAGFDDSAWTPVTLPHTWNAFDGEDGGNDYYRGVGWYRRHLANPAPSSPPRRAYLQIDGASMVADLYINEQLEAKFEAAQRVANWLNERIATLHWLPGNCERSAVLSNRAASAGKSRALADSRTLLSAPKNLTLDCA